MTKTYPSSKEPKNQLKLFKKQVKNCVANKNKTHVQFALYLEKD
jgi:hypothetical protein